MQIVEPHKSILILDDEFDIVSVLKQGIDKRGFRVFPFTDLYLALKHFQINFELYGLVISDLRMPGMNGYEFIEKVKGINPQVKVFFMTAFSINDIEFRRVLPFVKIDEFIEKPASLNKLVSLIDRYINLEIKN